jgi:glycosyltransferase involved in cell wall biosynthesis
VASDIEVLREYLVDGQNALLVAPDDPQALARALVRAVTDGALAATLRAGGLATAAHFDWGSSAERHLEIYRELLVDGRASAGRRGGIERPGVG